MDTNGISSNLYQRAVTPTLDVPIIPSVKGKSLASSYQSQPIATNTAFRKIGGASTANVVLNNVTVTGDGLLRGHSSASGKGIGHNGLNAGNTTTASAGVPSSSSANRGLHRGLVSSGVNTPLATVTSVSSIGFDLNLQGRGVIQTTTGLIMNTTSGLKGRDQTGPDQISPKFTKYDLVFLTDDIPADGIIFAKIRNVPDSIVIIRTPEVSTIDISIRCILYVFNDDHSVYLAFPVFNLTLSSYKSLQMQLTHGVFLMYREYICNMLKNSNISIRYRSVKRILSD